MEGEGRGSAEGTARVERAAARRPYLSLIDGVRGVAALVVLVYHYVHFFMAGPSRTKAPGFMELFPANGVLWPIYEWGYFAVQIFWLISGFVFAHVYYGHEASTRSFFTNRFARLYPLHLVTLLVVAGLQIVAVYRLGYTPVYGNNDWPHFIAQLFMAADWIRTGFSFNGPVWSVSVEIAVYAMFWFSRGLVARLGWPLLVAMIVAFYFADREWSAETRIFSCAAYFFAGALLCRVHQSPWGQGPRLAMPAILLPALGILGTMQWGDWGWRVCGIAGIFGALFLLLAEWQSRAPRWLDRACEWLGENTYGIYLWHFPIQLTLMLVLMPFVRMRDIAQEGWFLVLYLGVALAVARISYVWFERPMRDRLRRALT